MRRSSSSEPSCRSSAAVHVHLACSQVTRTCYGLDMFGIASPLCSSAPVISVSRLWLGPLLQLSGVCYSTRIQRKSKTCCSALPSCRSSCSGKATAVLKCISSTRKLLQRPDEWQSLLPELMADSRVSAGLSRSQRTCRWCGEVRGMAQHIVSMRTLLRHPQG